MLAKFKDYGIPIALIIFGLSALMELTSNDLKPMKKSLKWRKTMQFVDRLRYGKLKLSANSKSKNISWRWIGLSCLMTSLMPLLSGCVSNSLRSNPVVVQPSNVAITESSEASGFYQKLTNWRERVKVYLKRYARLRALQ